MGEPRPPMQDISSLIEYPETRYGRPCLAGTGISVKRMIYMHQMGETPEATAEDYDVAVSHVYAALALYYANKDWFDGKLWADQEEAYIREAEWLRQQLADVAPVG